MTADLLTLCPYPCPCPRYICLFLTVLSPSGLLSAHLKGRGVTAEAIAAFRSAAQACNPPSRDLHPISP